MNRPNLTLNNKTNLIINREKLFLDNKFCWKLTLL